MLIIVAVPANHLEPLDYLPLPHDAGTSDFENIYVIGKRVLVPLGTRVVVGVITARGELKSSTCPVDKLRPILAILDPNEPVYSPVLFDLLKWASEYYYFPFGLVLQAALPKKLTHADPENILKLKPVIFYDDIASTPKNIADMADPPELTLEQKSVVQTLCQNIQGFRVWVLEGVTGSGKTEVYCRWIQKILETRKQVLYLVPEIGLTPQTVHRIQTRFPNANIVMFHSRLTEKQKYLAWEATKTGHANIILGTRSASLIDFKNLGGCIIDEEHDGSYQQNTNFRYCAKNLLIKRAFDSKIPILLGSATLSLETVYNLKKQKFSHLKLTQRVNQQMLPVIQCLDLKKVPIRKGFGLPVLQLIQKKLEQQEQVLIFLNRRGYAPVLLCDDCQWQATCRGCEARLTIHHKKDKLICHHCTQQVSIPARCPKCQSPGLIRLGLGTERVENFLEKYFSTARLLRLDQDTMTPRKLISALDIIKNNQVDLILGTQMIAKGHDFQHVTLVVVLDLDSSLFASDFRATERMGQLLVQVSGRAGRFEKPGQIILQTRYPEHPVLKKILNQDYTQLTDHLIAERQLIGLPPVSYQAILQARSRREKLNLEFLNYIKEQIQFARTKELISKNVSCVGPYPSLRGKQGGYYQTQLLFQSLNRSELHRNLKYLHQRLTKKAIKIAGVQWVIQVDPQD